MSKWAMVFLSSFESVVSKLEKRSKNRASKKFVFNTRATAKERITRISSNNYNFLIFLSFAFGKDEVGGSNPPSSSKKHRKLRFSVFFCCKNTLLGVGQNVGQPPDPHPDPHGEMRGKGKRGADGISVRSSWFRSVYITCAMKLPIVCAASSCFCLVAWV